MLDKPETDELDRLDRFAAGGDAPATDAAEADAPSDADRRPDLYDIVDSFRGAAGYVDRILKGAEADAPSDADDPAQRAPVRLRSDFPPTCSVWTPNPMPAWEVHMLAAAACSIF